MKLKKKHLKLPGFYKKPALLFIALICFVSCANSNSGHTKCEEMCEYSRRDCIEGCGGYNSFGFSIDFSESLILSPYACSDKCEKISERCLTHCKERMDEIR
jgi:hypothetical protein